MSDEVTVTYVVHMDKKILGSGKCTRQQLFANAVAQTLTAVYELTQKGVEGIRVVDAGVTDEGGFKVVLGGV